MTVAYVGSQGRNLFLRSITNRITGFVENPTTGAGTVVREFSVVNGLTVTNRFAEIDTKTSGGSDHYNGLQVAINRHFSRGLTFGTQYVWSHSLGNTDGSKDARSGENNYSFASEYGNNISDVRQSFNLNMLYQLPYGSTRKAAPVGIRFPRSFSGDGSSGRCSMPGPVCPSMWKLPGIRPSCTATTRRES